jgi:hypothetical protein
MACAGKCTSIVAEMRCSKYFNQSSHPVLETFIAYSHQWQHIDFTLPMATFATLDTVKGSLPLLHTLDIDVSTTSTLHAFGYAPLLRSLTLAAKVDPNMIDVPWAQLTQC